jgi:hypothetical protein
MKEKMLQMMVNIKIMNNYDINRLRRRRRRGRRRRRSR